MNIQLFRFPPRPEFTDGILLIDGVWFGYTLEDRKTYQGRENVAGECCIPKGEYKVAVTFSEAFQRDMPLVWPVPGRSGIRFHGGNTAADVRGCIIVAYNRLAPGYVRGSKERILTGLIEKAGGEANLHIMEAT